MPTRVVLARTAKTPSRVFDQALAAVGGSQPVWQILISLKTSQLTNQRELADAVSTQGATSSLPASSIRSAGNRVRTAGT